jgi:hypothetical protein
MENLSLDVIEHLQKLTPFINWDDPQKISILKAKATEISKNGFPFDPNKLLLMIATCFAIFEMTSEEHVLNHKLPAKEKQSRSEGLF